MEAAVRPAGTPVVHDALAGLGEHTVVGIEQARELRGKGHGAVLDVGIVFAAFPAVIAEARRDRVADEFETQARGLPHGRLDRVGLEPCKAADAVRALGRALKAQHVVPYWQIVGKYGRTALGCAYLARGAAVD